MFLKIKGIHYTNIDNFYLILKQKIKKKKVLKIRDIIIIFFFSKLNFPNISLIIDILFSCT